MSRAFRNVALSLLFAVSACSPADEPGGGGPGGAGGASTGGGGGGGGGGRGGGSGGASANGGGGGAGSGGSAGTSAGGSGGASTAGGSGGSATGGAGAAGSGGSAGGGSGGSSDAGATPDGEDPPSDAAGSTDAPPIGPSAPGQGPVSPGMIVFSQDFEMGMNGISRSPNGLPADRAQIVDDPLNQRGKVMKVEWRSGDNFRTSGGTEPRSWISARPGHEFRPGTNVSHSFGFMMSSANTDYAFGQIISSGGPVWMLIVEGSGTLTVFCNTCGGNTRHMQLEPNRWYDFRVDLNFSVGGPVAFYINGQMFRMGRVTSTRGDIAHWDGGIYNRAAGTSANRTRTVYISNLSIGVR